MRHIHMLNLNYLSGKVYNTVNKPNSCNTGCPRCKQKLAIGLVTAKGEI